VEVNTANEAELDSVRGLGPNSTARILSARELGLFKDWTDLMRRVKGIKASTAAKLSATGLTVNQLPFTAPETGAKAP
jgi:competence protein ComEA